MCLEEEVTSRKLDSTASGAFGGLVIFFLIYKVGIRVPTSKGCCEDKRVNQYELTNTYAYKQTD